MSDAPRTGPLTPYITVKDAGSALAFYRDAFGATERFRLTDPSGRIGHAEMSLGGSSLYLSDEFPDFGALSPTSIGGSPVKLHLYVDDVDSVVAKAAAAGATILRPVSDQFYGDRSGMIVDPFGHAWFIATHREDVTPAEMQRRWNAALQGSA
ncbi:MAG: VOC family protein [Geminicoccaceae bacterium]